MPPKGTPEYDKYLEKNREYQRKWFAKNREEQRKRVRNNTDKVVNSNRAKLIEYLTLHPCIDCGEDDPIVLDCDHLRDKKYNISYMMKRGYCWESILQELEKCEIRCANCHRRRTSQQFDWWYEGI